MDKTNEYLSCLKDKYKMLEKLRDNTTYDLIIEWQKNI